MYLTSTDISSFDEEKLRLFVGKKIQEGLNLDYKEKMSGATKRESYREFLKDVTAFANAQGGNILIGVKEPKEDIPCEEQIEGLTDGTNLAEDLERLASQCIDPRIPGLRILSISLSNGGAVILVHIPPSLGRPHMVNHEKHRTFYIRHWESSFPMSAHEIREAVLVSLSSEARAKSYMEMMEADAIQYHMQGTPMVLMQAMPLIQLEQPWSIDDEITEIVRGGSRHNKYGSYSLDTRGASPQLIIEGLQGKVPQEDPYWITEVHRNGYIYAGFRNKKKHTRDIEGFFFFPTTCNLFKSFCDFCIDLLDATGTDLPYILKCKYVGARDTIFVDKELHGFEEYSEPYIKDKIVWPDQVRQIGDDFMKIAEAWGEQLFNAFNKKKPVK